MDREKEACDVQIEKTVEEIEKWTVQRFGI
jgi:hypothetical protein